MRKPWKADMKLGFMDDRKLALTKPHFKTTIFKSFLSYLRKKHPHVDIGEIVSQTGLDLEYFLDENNWVSVEVERKFVAACYDLTKEKNLSFIVGTTALSKENIGALTYQFLRYVAPISEIFDRLPKMVALANRVFVVRTIRGGPNTVDVEYSINRSVVSEYEFQLLTESFPSIMENIRGYFHAIMALKDCTTPKVDYQVEMTSDGSPIGRFRVGYSKSRSLGLLAQFAVGGTLGSLIAGLFAWSGHSFTSWAMIVLPTTWLLTLLYNYRNLKSVADETEHSLGLLDAQYSELHQTKQLLTEQLNESRLINEVSAALLRVSDEKALLSTACEGLIQHIGFDRVIILLHDEEAEKLAFSVSAGEDSERLGKMLSGFSLNLKKQGVSEHAISSVFRSGRPILISDVRRYLSELTENESKWALLESGSLGFACTPIHTGTTRYGVMIADVVNAKIALNEDKLRLLSIVANQMAIFLEKQRAKQSLVDAYESEVRLAEAYSKFVPMETLKMLNYSSIHDVTIGDGVEKDLTVLFSDIRGFTSLCESMSPSEVLRFLNSYYGRLSPIIRRHNGIIDKFIGDGLMAIFANYQDAVEAAIEMQRELILYNLEKRTGRRKPLVAGIGISKGPMIFGPLGADKRLQLTVLSDSVNLASRLDGLCSQFDARIMLSLSDLDELNAREEMYIKKFEGTSIKGKSKHIDVVELIDSNLLGRLSESYGEEHQRVYLEEQRARLKNKMSEAIVLSKKREKAA